MISIGLVGYLFRFINWPSSDDYKEEYRKRFKESRTERFLAESKQEPEIKKEVAAPIEVKIESKPIELESESKPIDFGAQRIDPSKPSHYIKG